MFCRLWDLRLVNLIPKLCDKTSMVIFTWLCRSLLDWLFSFLQGMVIGFLIKYIGGESRVAVAQPNCTISSAAKKLHIRTLNGSQYSYTLTGPVQEDNSTDQGSELEQLVHK